MHSTPIIVQQRSGRARAIRPAARVPSFARARAKARTGASRHTALGSDWLAKTRSKVWEVILDRPGRLRLGSGRRQRCVERSQRTGFGESWSKPGSRSKNRQLVVRASTTKWQGSSLKPLAVSGPLYFSIGGASDDGHSAVEDCTLQREVQDYEQAELTQCDLGYLALGLSTCGRDWKREPEVFLDSSPRLQLLSSVLIEGLSEYLPGAVAMCNLKR